MKPPGAMRHAPDVDSCDRMHVCAPKCGMSVNDRLDYTIKYIYRVKSPDAVQAVGSRSSHDIIQNVIQQPITHACTNPLERVWSLESCIPELPVRGHK